MVARRSIARWGCRLPRSAAKHMSNDSRHGIKRWRRSSSGSTRTPSRHRQLTLRKSKPRLTTALRRSHQRIVVCLKITEKSHLACGFVCYIVIGSNACSAANIPHVISNAFFTSITSFHGRRAGRRRKATCEPFAQLAISVEVIVSTIRPQPCNGQSIRSISCGASILRCRPSSVSCRDRLSRISRHKKVAKGSARLLRVALQARGLQIFGAVVAAFAHGGNMIECSGEAS
jgi:hypothetical protein